MLDLRATYNTAGSLTGVNPSDIAGNDGSQVAGVPIDTGAILVAWGANALAAKFLKSVYLTSQDQEDPLNGEQIQNLLNATMLAFANPDNLPYTKGKRQVFVVQHVAGQVQTFTLDHYGKGQSIAGSKVKGRVRNIIIPITGNACVLNTWVSSAFTPTTAIPQGKYAILGAWVSNISGAPSLLRFNHANFSGCKPGFPVNDLNNDIEAICYGDQMMWHEMGYQFVYLSQITGQPCCPVFTCNSTGTGLNFEVLANSTPTPTVSVNLLKVG